MSHSVRSYPRRSATKSSAKPPAKSRGIALLSVLLILSLMVILAAEMSQAFRQQLSRSQSQQSLDQAYWFAMSAEQLATIALQKTFANKPKTVNLSQPWAQTSQQFPVEGVGGAPGGTISGELHDAQACFNINALAKVGRATENGATPEVQVFQALLQYLGLTPTDAEQIAQSTRNWVSNNELPNQGAGDSDYSGLPVPYLSGRAPMRDVSEWRTVAGVVPVVALRVMPFLCTLPSTELAVNVNTIANDQPELLAALYIEQLPVDQAATVLSARPEKGWDSVEAFLSQPQLANFASTGVNERLAVTSQYFTLTANATAGNSTMMLNSLLMRSPGETGNQQKIAVIRRQFGAPL